MLYISTRGNHQKVQSAEAIKTGMVPAGGLFVPEKIPHVLMEDISGKGYQELAEEIFGAFLTDFSHEEIREMIGAVYNASVFQTEEVTPLVMLSEKMGILELWHGPTAAFKDVALQMLPHLMVKALDKCEEKKEIVILVATSGDTGKAALEGFKNIPGIRIICLYPYQKVSKMQELQMTTTDGDNTYVIAVKGNFDDCQNKVKEIFADQDYQAMLEEKQIALSSANSINWGRLLPQIVYYFKAYNDLVKNGRIVQGDTINFVVPTGNFGNILAAWYAGQMGLPIHKLICASNVNNILTDFINTGKYDKRREFVETNSPSMDILISSNLERFLFEISNRDARLVRETMASLQEAGFFQLDSKTLEKVQETLYGNYATEAETMEMIRTCFSRHGYLLDTHTAVGMRVYEKYLRDTRDTERVTIIDATANPYKFNRAVMESLKGIEAVEEKEEFAILEELAACSGQPVHPGLAGLDKRPVLHNRVAELNQLQEMVTHILLQK